MAVASSTATIIGATIALAGTAASTYASYQQAQAQKREAQAQADYQAAVAEQNQALAAEQARAQRREGYEEMIKTRQETAALVGKQRAIAGASGAQADAGSFLDLTLDTTEKGEIDALAAYQKGLDAAYNTEIQAWGYGQQAEGYKMASSQASKRNPWAAAGATAISGLTQIGTGFGKDLWGLGGAPKVPSGGTTAFGATAEGNLLNGANWLNGK